MLLWLRLWWLRRRLEDDDDHRDRVLAAAARLGRPAAPGLIRWLDRDDDDVREIGAVALGMIGERRAVRPLIGRLHDPTPGVRRAAAAALGALGDSRAVGPLAEALDDRQAGVRRAAQAALDALGGEFVAEALLDAVRESEDRTRYRLSEFLRSTRDARAAGPLRQALSDQEGPVRAAAAEALGWLGDPAATSSLTPLLWDPDPAVWRATHATLGSLGPRPTVPEADVRFALDRGDVERAVALGGHAVLPHIKTPVTHPETARRLVEALGEWGGAWSLDLLTALTWTSDDIPQVLRAIAAVVERDAAAASELDLRRLCTLQREFWTTRAITEPVYGDRFVGCDDLSIRGNAEREVIGQREVGHEQVKVVVDCSHVRQLARQELLRRGHKA